MQAKSAGTPFPLGVYLGNPDNSSKTNEATFDTNYNNFVTLMGAAPQFLVTYVDYNQQVSQWVSNSQWAASSFAQSPGAKSTTPVIGLPMASNAAGSATPDQQFQAFASGQYDSVIKGIVQAWAQQGFKNLIFRPGWEMNLQGPTYAGSTAQSQADWVSAFQHIYTALHQAAAASGVNVQVVWNPNTTNYDTSATTTRLYPGDSYVDIVGADSYADIHPYSDSSPTPTYHDWDTGKEDTTVAQFIADPINRAHYWSYPAATEWSNDSSGGHNLSLNTLIGFAEQHGKPFALPETGAGSSNSGTDVSDDAAYPQWLAAQLNAAQAAGEKISFVDLWDSNGGSNYEFANPSDNKPQEAAAWAKNFGAAQGNTPTTGADTLDLHVSEDAWQGDAQFTVTVDGTRAGGTYTATASHAAGATQDLSITGSWGAGPHTVGIAFINDAYGGSYTQDRNLYLDQATYDGAGAIGAPAALMRNGTANLTVPAAGPTTAITLRLAEDAWKGDALYAVAIDGKTYVQNATVIAPNAQNQSQAVTLQAALTAGSHDVAVSFLNDAWGGTAATDRNLYVKEIDVAGKAATGSSAALLGDGTTHFQIVVPSS